MHFWFRICDSPDRPKFKIYLIYLCVHPRLVLSRDPASFRELTVINICESTTRPVFSSSLENGIIKSMFPPIQFRQKIKSLYL